MYKKATKKVKKSKLNCVDSKTKELLELGIEEIYERFNYPKEVYTEGQNNYAYNKLYRLMNDAKEFQKISLYDWKCDYIRNLQSLGYELYTTPNDMLFVKVAQKKRKSEIILWEDLNQQGKKYFAVNAYFSILLGNFNDSDKKLIFCCLNTSKEDIPDIKEPNVSDIDEETVGVLIENIDFDVAMFTRQLILPYDDFIKNLNKYANKDEFETLDYLCTEYNYPRSEIKKRIIECNLIKEMEKKNSALGGNPKKKIKGKLRELIGFKEKE